MKNSQVTMAIVITIIVGIVSYYFAANKENVTMANAMVKAGLSAPEYVDIEYSTEKKDLYIVKYGLGGRTCKSFIKMEDGVITEEFGKKCWG